ncbi:tripartite tricarboxylate transporter substrate binding protein [Pseudacidovorax sp. RU35E]|uniref:Bug family tripartite tricarboxylate transporter substrate binding protein n=1 Tax=Pseudacidovorax sp. RU35E TaxID=1907403 RepID=UPI0009548394|nr:tripartite tricarboxylate transporter substrate binding protein [Pseudacidovorax sp. RU35E]SIR76331.1 Tripartite-type tricarboxylate transporter, receptor component TctC [Pseudacidovorax sp. RU35E]
MKLLKKSCPSSVSARRKFAVGLFALTGLVAAPASAESAYPSKPIRMVVAFAAGGSTDIVARSIGVRLSEALGVPVVIDNRGGANGTIGSDVVAKAAPDGYTIMMGEVGSLAMAPGLYPKLPYDPSKDFAPITLVARTPLLALVKTDSPIKSLADLIANARANPGKLSYPSSGAGGPNHLAGELFNMQANVKTLHVPYKGGGPAALSLVSGETDFGLLSRVTIDAQLQGGRARALAVASDQRLPNMPNVPTFAEAGLPGYTAETWFMLVAPAGTPQPIVDRLNAEVAKILPNAETKERFAAMGAFGVGNSPAAATTFLKSELAKWTKVSKAADIRLD